MSWILCDIGGTHIRFAQSGAGIFAEFQKYKITQFKTLSDALYHYCKDMNCPVPRKLALSSTSWLEDGQIKYRRFQDGHVMDVSLETLKSDLSLDEIVFLNDYEAAGLGVYASGAESFKIMKTAQGTHRNNVKCILGIGTGAGHAYIDEAGYITKTYGGHMRLCAHTQDQFDALEWIKKNNPQDRDLIVEDAVSGRGLISIYHFISGQKDVQDFETLLERLKNKDETSLKTLQLFLEFAAQHAQNLLHIPFAYGGLYLTGGVVDMLIAHGLWQSDRFNTYLHGRAVSVVENAIHSCPVYYCLEQNLPLTGLNYFVNSYA